MRAPRWRFEADVTLPNGSRAVFRAQGRPRAAGRRAPVGGLPRRPNYDSAFERSLASDFRRRFGKEPRNEWTLSRESSPVAVGTELFLPDFTFRHADGREALVEIVGFWTPEYLAEKVRKVTAAKLDSLVLVVYRGLAVGGATAALEAAAGANRIVWFANKPRAPEVLEAVERWAVAPRGRNE
jgi:predicted nuclease of restriction endonuclease-like RecB superfamily